MFFSNLKHFSIFSAPHGRCPVHNQSLLLLLKIMTADILSIRFEMKFRFWTFWASLITHLFCNSTRKRQNTSSPELKSLLRRVCFHSNLQTSDRQIVWRPVDGSVNAMPVAARPRLTRSRFFSTTCALWDFARGFLSSCGQREFLHALAHKSISRTSHHL
jgi:hypothetical protein